MKHFSDFWNIFSFFHLEIFFVWVIFPINLFSCYDNTFSFTIVVRKSTHIVIAFDIGGSAKGKYFCHLEEQKFSVGQNWFLIFKNMCNIDLIIIGLELFGGKWIILGRLAAILVLFTSSNNQIFKQSKDKF